MPPSPLVPSTPHELFGTSLSSQQPDIQTIVQSRLWRLLQQQVYDPNAARSLKAFKLVEDDSGERCSSITDTPRDYQETVDNSGRTPDEPQTAGEDTALVRATATVSERLSEHPHSQRSTFSSQIVLKEDHLDDFSDCVNQADSLSPYPTEMSGSETGREVDDSIGTEDNRGCETQNTFAIGGPTASDHGPLSDFDEGAMGTCHWQTSEEDSPIGTYLEQTDDTLSMLSSLFEEAPTMADGGGGGEIADHELFPATEAGDEESTSNRDSRTNDDDDDDDDDLLLPDSSDIGEIFERDLLDVEEGKGRRRPTTIRLSESLAESPPKSLSWSLSSTDTRPQEEEVMELVRRDCISDFSSELEGDS